MTGEIQMHDYATWSSRLIAHIMTGEIQMHDYATWSSRLIAHMTGEIR